MPIIDVIKGSFKGFEFEKQHVRLKDRLILCFNRQLLPYNLLLPIGKIGANKYPLKTLPIIGQ